MSEEKDQKPARKKRGDRYARFYTVVGVTSLTLAITIIAAATVISGKVSTKVDDPTVDNPQVEAPVPEQPEIVVDNTMAMPMLVVSLTNDHGFYYNQTLDQYTHHDGVDFSAEVGTAVFCSLDGVVESITTDTLCGTEITLSHDDGLTTVYRYVDVEEGLSVGAKVQRGQKIASVAEANGSEYKEGAHLHFEVQKNGASMDPADYLPVGEK